MTGYGQYCPVALAAEVFAERWTPIILRNLMIGCERFGDILEGAPGLSRSVLTQRLKRLGDEGVVDHQPGGGYGLTASGRELAGVVLALGAWGARWREVLPEHHDPYLMLWMLSRLIDPSSLPRTRIVVRFDLISAGRGRRTGYAGPDRYWVVASSRGNEVCTTTPGFAEDAIVTCDPAWLHRWHSGRSTLAAGERAGAMSFAGPRWLHRTLTSWGKLSPYAGTAAPSLMLTGSTA